MFLDIDNKIINLDNVAFFNQNREGSDINFLGGHKLYVSVNYQILKETILNNTGTKEDFTIIDDKIDYSNVSDTSIVDTFYNDEYTKDDDAEINQD